MSELISAIKSINERDWFDYFSAFLPLLLSLVAIIIAIDTARSQNRIALFDKRYNNYSELLGLCSLWKMFADQYNRLYQENIGMPIDTLYKLCLTFSLLGHGDKLEIDLQDYVLNHNLDRDKVCNALIDLTYKDSMTLEVASLLYGKRTRKIKTFHKDYNSFQDHFRKALYEQVSQEIFQVEVSIFRNKLNNFYKMIYTSMEPKVKITS